MKGKLAIGAALMLCLAFVVVAPVAAAGGQDGQSGQQASWQNATQENTAAGSCVCASSGDCQQDRSVNQTKAMTSTGDGTCDSTCDQIRDRTHQQICQTE